MSTKVAHRVRTFVDKMCYPRTRGKKADQIQGWDANKLLLPERALDLGTVTGNEDLQGWSWKECRNCTSCFLLVDSLSNHYDFG